MIKRKVFKLENLKRNNKIVISSKDNIDFSKVSTHVIAYFDDFSKPVYDFYAELYIFNNNQAQTTIFEIPIMGNKCAIVIETFSDYDLESLVVQSINN